MLSNYQVSAHVTRLEDKNIVPCMKRGEITLVLDLRDTTTAYNRRSTENRMSFGRLGL